MKFIHIKNFLARYMLETILLLVCIALAISAPQFLTVENLLNVLRSVSIKGLLAFGMTMVIIAGEIDLSVASAVALGGCLVAYFTQAGLPLVVGIPLTVVICACFGTFAGLARVKWEIPSFISTLALYLSLRGIALHITGGFPIAPFPEWFHFLGGGHVLGVPFPAVVFLTVFGGTAFVMKRTVFGKAVYAVGGNAEAARLAGINVGLVRVLIFTISGALAAVSGTMLAARIMSGQPTVAVGWELDAIAAVIVGGTSFQGGKGAVWGTLIGVIFIGVIINGMTLLDVSSSHQLVMRGVLIFAAVWINRIQKGRV